MRSVNLKQNTPEWLEFRKKHIGSSDAMSILHTSPWKTRYETFLDKIGLGKPSVDNYAMAIGREREDEARTEFERLTGLIMSDQVVLHDEYEFISASLDGIDLERENILEIKCPGQEDHGKAMQGIVPEKYIPQLQHQLFVTGLDMLYYFSYTPMSNNIVEVYRDQKYIDNMFKEHCKFWECVQKMEPPQLTERDYVTKTDEFWLEVEKKWVLTRTELRELERREKELRETLINMCGTQNCRGRHLQVQKVVRKGNIDYASMPQIQGVDCEPYRKSASEFWKIGDLK